MRRRAITPDEQTLIHKPGEAIRDSKHPVFRISSILIGWSLITVFSWVGLAQCQRVRGEIISTRFGMYAVHGDRVGTVVTVLPPQAGLWDEVYGSMSDYKGAAESGGATAGSWLDKNHRHWAVPGCSFYVSVPQFPYHQFVINVSHWSLLLAVTSLFLVWFYFRRSLV